MEVSRSVQMLVLGLIVIGGSMLRLNNIETTVVSEPVRADAADYVAYTYNLRIHGVYSRNLDVLRTSENMGPPAPDAFRSPGYPLFLMLFSNQTDMPHFNRSVVTTQAVLSVLVILFAFLMAQYFLGPVGGLITATLTALSPHLINVNNYLLTESLFCFLLMAGLTLLSHGPPVSKMSKWLLAGLILGAATLVKPTLQYLIVPLSVFLFLTLRQNRRLPALLWFLAPYLALVALWVFRNWWTMGISSDTTLATSIIHHGMYPGMMFEGRPETLGVAYGYDPESKEITGSLQSILATIIDRFRDSPWEYLGWYLSKPLYLFNWRIIAGQGDVFIFPTPISPYFNDPIFKLSHQLMKAIHPTIIWLSLIGSVFAWLPKKLICLSERSLFAVRLISIVYWYFIAVHFVGAPYPRYSVPIRPLSYALALFVPFSIIRLRKERIKVS